MSLKFIAASCLLFFIALVPLSAFADEQCPRPSMVDLITTSDFHIVKKEGYWGAIDNDSKTLIPFTYDAISPIFYCGNTFFIVRKENLMGLVDKENNEILPIKYDKIRNNLDDFETVFIISRRLNKALSYSLKTRKITGKDIPISETYGDLTSSQKPAGNPSEFKEDLTFKYDEATPIIGKLPTNLLYIRVKKNNLYGIIDENEKIILPIEYDYIEDFTASKDTVLYRKGKKSGLLNIASSSYFKKLKKYDAIDSVDKIEDVFIASYKHNQEDIYELIDAKGNGICKNKSLNIKWLGSPEGNLKDGVLIPYRAKNSLYGYLDKHCDIKIQPVYENLKQITAVQDTYDLLF